MHGSSHISFWIYLVLIRDMMQVRKKIQKTRENRLVFIYPNAKRYQVTTKQFVVEKVKFSGEKKQYCLLNWNKKQRIS